jgi:hypothetical protein
MLSPSSRLYVCCCCLQHLMKRIQRGPVRGISLKLQVCAVQQQQQEQQLMRQLRGSVGSRQDGSSCGSGCAVQCSAAAHLGQQLWWRLQSLGYTPCTATAVAGQQQQAAARLTAATATAAQCEQAGERQGTAAQLNQQQGMKPLASLGGKHSLLSTMQHI